MAAKTTGTTPEKILDDLPYPSNLVDARLLAEIEACCAEARRLAEVSEDVVRKRALMAGLQEIKRQLNRIAGLVEKHRERKAFRPRGLSPWNTER